MHSQPAFAVVLLCCRCCLQGGLRNPMDEMAPDVPKSCVVYIATTDGALRMCYLTNFKQAQGLARAPQPVPATLPPQLTAALAEAGRLAAQDEVGCECWSLQLSL